MPNTGYLELQKIVHNLRFYLTGKIRKSLENRMILESSNSTYVFCFVSFFSFIIIICGAPEFDIPKSVLEGQLEEGVTIEQISSMLSVSERTVYRRMERYGLRSLNFSNISDDDLDGHKRQLSKDFPLEGIC